MPMKMHNEIVDTDTIVIILGSAFVRRAMLAPVLLAVVAEIVLDVEIGAEVLPEDVDEVEFASSRIMSVAADTYIDPARYA